MGGTKRQEYKEFVANEMNTDTLAYILTLALEATQLELKKVRKELEKNAKSIEKEDAQVRSALTTWFIPLVPYRCRMLKGLTITSTTKAF